MTAITIAVIIAILLVIIFYSHNSGASSFDAIITSSFVVIIGTISILVMRRNFVSHDQNVPRVHRVPRVPTVSHNISGGGSGGNKQAQSVLNFRGKNIFVSSNDPPVSYPLYSLQVSLKEVQSRAKEIQSVLSKIIKEDHEPYKLVTVNTKTDVVGDKLLLPVTNKYSPLRFVSDWKDTADYDNLAVYFSEQELLNCSTGSYRSMRDNFNLYGGYLWQELKRTTAQPTIEQFRDFIFENIKSCHNFRVSLAAKIYDYFGSKSILDFSAGHGDRLFAACAMGIKYLGIDPNTAVHSAYDKIIENIGDRKDQAVIVSGAEYLPTSFFSDVAKKIGIEPGADFDLLFTSPPYYDYEVYSTGPQSVNVYTNTFERWLVDFLLYTVVKYSRHIKPQGYIVLYIQDVGGDTYIEPIILFILAWQEYLHMDYVGIFSSNRFPSIVFRKSDTTGKILGFHNYHQLLQEHYPAIYAIAHRMWKTGIDNIIYDVSPKYQVTDSGKNIIIFDTGSNSSICRAIFKLFLTETIQLSNPQFIWYGTKAIGKIILYMQRMCKSQGVKLTYCVAKNEMIYTEIQPSIYLNMAISEGLQVDTFDNRNAALDITKFLQKEIARKYDRILPHDIFSTTTQPFCTEAIRELLLVMNNYHDMGAAITDHNSFTGTVFTDANPAYLRSLYIIFPNAQLCVLVSQTHGSSEISESTRTKFIYLQKSEKTSINASEYFIKHSAPGDVLLLTEKSRNIHY